jgi:hypothetical protein
MKWDTRKGYSGKRFSQAVFGFPKTLLASAKLRQSTNRRVDSHLFPLFGITTGWAGGDEGGCIWGLWQKNAKALMQAPAVLQPFVEELEVDDGKSISLDHEDKEAFSCAIEFLAGLVKAAVDFMEEEEIKLAGEKPLKRDMVVGSLVLARQQLKRGVVERHWGERHVSGICWGGYGRPLTYMSMSILLTGT